MSAREHDPLCADFNKHARVWCICDRLAAAREDEREKAVERVMALDWNGYGEGNAWIGRPQILDAIRATKPVDGAPLHERGCPRRGDCPDDPHLGVHDRCSHVCTCGATKPVDGDR